MTPRNYFPAQTKHGFAPAYTLNGEMAVEGYPGTVPTLAECKAECDRRNRQQIDDARKRLADAQGHMDAVLLAFDATAH